MKYWIVNNKNYMNNVQRIFNHYIFYLFRVYRNTSNTIVCHYEQSSQSNITLNKQYSFLSSNAKRIYLLIIVVFRVAVPFVLLFTANIASIYKCT